jgi:hypothetical protein
VVILFTRIFPAEDDGTRKKVGIISGCTAYFLGENVLISTRHLENVLFCTFKYMVWKFLTKMLLDGTLHKFSKSVV